MTAVLQCMVAVAAIGAAVGALLFAGSELLPRTSLPFYVVGVGAAIFAAMLTVWLHGRVASTSSTRNGKLIGGDVAQTSYLMTSRLQTLLGAAFAVKLAVLVIGVLALKQFPLAEEPAKFIELATFAVTFAGAALLCQLGTAFALARILRQRAPAA